MSSLKSKEILKGERVYFFAAAASNLVVSSFRYKDEWHALGGKQKCDLLDLSRSGGKARSDTLKASDADIEHARALCIPNIRTFTYIPESEPIVRTDELQEVCGITGSMRVHQYLNGILALSKTMGNATILYRGLMIYGYRGGYHLDKLLGFDSSGRLLASGVRHENGELYRFNLHVKDVTVLLYLHREHFRALGFIDDNLLLVASVNSRDPEGVLSKGSYLRVHDLLGSRSLDLDLSEKELVFKITKMGQNQFLLYTNQGLFRLTVDGENIKRERIPDHALLAGNYHPDMGIHYDLATGQIWVSGSNFIGFNDGNWHLTKFNPGSCREKWAFGTALGKAYFIMHPSDIHADFTRTFETDFTDLSSAVKRGDLIAPF